MPIAHSFKKVRGENCTFFFGLKHKGKEEDWSGDSFERLVVERAANRQQQDESERTEDRRLGIRASQNSDPLLRGRFQKDEVCLSGADTAVQLSVTTLMITSSVTPPASLAIPDQPNWLLHKDT